MIFPADTAVCIHHTPSFFFPARGIGKSNRIKRFLLAAAAVLCGSLLRKEKRKKRDLSVAVMHFVIPGWSSQESVYSAGCRRRSNCRRRCVASSTSRLHFWVGRVYICRERTGRMSRRDPGTSPLDFDLVTPLIKWIDPAERLSSRGLFHCIITRRGVSRRLGGQTWQAYPYRRLYLHSLCADNGNSDRVGSRTKQGRAKWIRQHQTDLTKFKFVCVWRGRSARGRQRGRQIKVKLSNNNNNNKKGYATCWRGEKKRGRIYVEDDRMSKGNIIVSSN